MNPVNCLIVDDEPIAREIIQTYCSHFPALKVVASCSNALEARQVLQQFKTDILFLDINMPVMDGISFIKTLKYQPQVIFTTAYKEYAVNAFDLAACDYLLKPFSLDRFILAVDRAMERLQGTTLAVQENIVSNEADFIFIKADGKIYKIGFDELLFAEANGNYTKVVTVQHTLLPGITFSGFEEQLPSSRFLRVHRSFLINKSRITHIEGNRVYINKIEIPIGSNYKEAFLKELGIS
jgi:DNA-binding LytR/AlgR family response regulator